MKPHSGRSLRGLLLLLGGLLALAGCDWFGATAPATPTPPVTQAPGTPALASPPAASVTSTPGAGNPAPGTATGGVGSPGTPAPQGGTLTLGLPQDVTTLNPFFIARSTTELDTAAQTVTGLIFSGLTRLDNHLQPVPDLAQSWTVAPDGLSVDFALRSGALWSDGAPVTVDDIIWTYESYLQLQVPTTLQTHLRDAVLAIEPAKTTTDTVRFWLKKKYAPLLTDLAAPILPKHLLGDVPLERMIVNPFSYHPVGSGPFMFDARQEGQSITLTANQRYYGGRPNLDGVTFQVLTDTQATTQALTGGSLLGAEVPYAAWQATAARPDSKSLFNLGSYPAPGYYFVAFNLRAGHLFSDTAMRQAVAYALDKTTLVQAATGGAGLPVWTDVAPESWAAAPNAPRLDHDPDKARSLLDQAGWQPGPDGIRRKDGKPLAFTLTVPAGDPARRAAADQMQTALTTVGISMTVTPADFNSVILAKLDPRHEPAFDFDALLLGWDSTSTDPDDFALFHSSQVPTAANPGGLNFPGFAAPEFDQVTIDARSEYDFAKRAALQARLQEILAQQLPYYFLWSDQRFVVLNHRVNGPLDLASPRWLWNVDQWWLAKE